MASTMAQLAHQQECCAWIHPLDAFDPATASVADVDLFRLLWVRCYLSRRLKPLEQAFKAADILVQNGAFRLITLDLGSIDEESLRQAPLTICFRFARAMKKNAFRAGDTGPPSCAKRCAGMTLFLNDFQDVWASRGDMSHALLFSHGGSEVEIARHVHKPVCIERPRFQAGPIWT
jgi:hypothetical protein